MAKPSGKVETLPIKLREAVMSGDGEAILEALTEKQRQFCYEFLKDLNASRAVVRAGYETSNPNRIGSQLKQHAGIKAALEYLQQDRQKQMSVDAHFVLEKIIKSIDRAEQRGNETAVLRGAELLAKHLGMFVERSEVSGPEGSDIRIAQQQKLEEDVRDFTSAISRLANRGATKQVPEPTEHGSDSKT